MNTIRLILLFLISSPVFNVAADTYYGTLRGENLIELKSPYSGVVEHNLKVDGNVKKNISPLIIKSIELESKKEIINLKINTLSAKISRLMNEYKSAQNSYEKGFTSGIELNQKKDAINEAEISLRELKIELTALEKVLEMGNPTIHRKFLVRQFHTADKQLVNAGDRTVSIEIIDNLYIDFKFDPVTIKGRIQDKDITVKSLVTGHKSKAIVSSVSNSVSNNNTQGAKVASLLIKTEEIDLTQLLDTVFEIHINDKN
ncbi:TPA: hypothetical protein H2W70_004540 [Salmonella enterica]|nr:hypothetical protein [Salmonella enterica subsp. enterica serovar Chester]HAF2404567.1 hypothetical protein [Salmonella enterica]EDH8245928.1 hypothetical protein [Salmonella enterica subsp. enterica serovar Chester]HAK7515995.1 hypothetical protein [Salmonella enterica]HAK8066910.1 hypothetical protein [Salmonella enterica]